MYIDFHSHILPAAAHGSQSVEESMSLLSVAYDAGIRTVVATPHFYPAKRESVDSFLERRDHAYQKLYNAMQKDDKLREIKLLKGAEVMLSLSLYEIEGLEKLCAEGTNHILIERNPSRSLSTEELNSLLQVSDLGLNPIIAHLDRYDEKSQQGLLKSGFDVQLNVSAFSKFLKKGRYIEMSRLGYVKALGSDTHQEELNYQQYKKAVKALGPTAEKIMKYTSEILGL